LELKKQGKAEEARALIRTEGVPLWLKLAPLVREVLLDFQEIVSTRNDLGTLASMHNKYERLALYRLRASMKEFLGELPSETASLFAAVRRPDQSALPRVFIPTRATMLGAEDRVRIFAVVAGAGEVTRVSLLTRKAGVERWSDTPMKHVARKTFVGELKVPGARSALFDYYVEAEAQKQRKNLRLTAPLEAPARFYTTTLL
jgi:hypothetical protein